ncbi:MAG: mucoidy inhibitor MuiA [Microscillaceae bacterium]
MNAIPLLSKIVAVTVFSERAEITRQAEIYLEKGTHRLQFAKLPPSLMADSLHLSGIGPARLGQVRHRLVFSDEIIVTTLKNWEEENIRVKAHLQTLDDQLALLHKEEEVIEQLARKMTTPNPKQAHDFEPEKWQVFLGFYRAQLEALALARRQAQKEKENWLCQAERLEQQRSEMQTYKKMAQSEVEVVIEMQEAATLQLELAYLAQPAHWKPAYEIRVLGESKIMHLTYNALVQQNTGEDWSEVNLKFSTARPHISGQAPELSPWRIQLFNPTLLPQPKRAESTASGMANMMMASKPMMEEALAVSDEPYAMLEKPASTISTQTTAVLFEPPGQHTVKTGATDHQITIAQERFEAHFRYTSVPKLSPFAYLKARVRNSTDYPFLAGTTSIFLDQHFVAQAKMEHIAPGEEFWTSLGIDENMKIKHQFLKKYEKKEGGFFSKKTQIMIYEYQITLTNYKKTTEEMVVWDQLPISQNAEISVNLLTPSYKEDSGEFKKNELEYLEWFLNLPPGQTHTLLLKFSVEYPRGAVVLGLV